MYTFRANVPVFYSFKTLENLKYIFLCFQGEENSLRMDQVDGIVHSTTNNRQYLNWHIDNYINYWQRNIDNGQYFIYSAVHPTIG